MTGGGLMVSDGPGCYEVPVRDVLAALVWLVYRVEVVRVVRVTRDGPHASYFAPRLPRPVIWSCRVN